MDLYLARRDRLRKALKKADSTVEALLVTDFTNVTYLTGFTGDDSFLLVFLNSDVAEAVMISDSRYTTQLSEECPGLAVDVRRSGVAINERVAKTLKAAKVSRVALEANSVTLAQHKDFLKEIPGVEFSTTSNLVEKLRMIKDKDEIERIRRAVWIAEKSFDVLKATLRPNKTEKQVADDLEHQFRLFGARERGFPSIVGVGPRAALPHAVPGSTKVCESDFILVDWGADADLYKSDLTRVLVTGKISAKLRRIHEVVLEAQTRAIAAIRPGVKTDDVDKVARDTIAEAGYGKYFGHGLGHGLGLQIHESPYFSPKRSAVLKAGMVVTVEPGIYFEGWGGVRIEDDVLVTRTGNELLTSVPRTLEESIIS